MVKDSGSFRRSHRFPQQRFLFPCLVTLYLAFRSSLSPRSSFFSVRNHTLVCCILRFIRSFSILSDQEKFTYASKSPVELPRVYLAARVHITLRLSCSREERSDWLRILVSPKFLTSRFLHFHLFHSLTSLNSSERVMSSPGSYSSDPTSASPSPAASHSTDAFLSSTSNDSDYSTLSKLTRALLSLTGYIIPEDTPVSCLDSHLK